MMTLTPAEMREKASEHLNEALLHIVSAKPLCGAIIHDDGRVDIAGCYAEMQRAYFDATEALARMQRLIQPLPDEDEETDRA